MRTRLMPGVFYFLAVVCSNVLLQMLGIPVVYVIYGYFYIDIYILIFRISDYLLFHTCRILTMKESNR
jgi:uncharacterized membrane protein YvlD (DUF360 family)